MKTIKVAEYLIQELNKIGITDVFGVPGDYNFDLVEAVTNSKSTNWIGCNNELNAGYAADGYSREKGYGAIITTFGVGELSAINAIAGCMAENIPVIKITGVPTTKNIENNSLLHHTLPQTDYFTFYRVYKNFVEASAFLNKDNAKQEIDRLINVMITSKKPVYLAIPIDIATMKIENTRQDNKKNQTNVENLDIVVEKILEMIQNSKNPMVIADGLVKTFKIKSLLNGFLEKTNIPSTCFAMGLGIINSDIKNFLGAYVGKYDNKICYDYLNNSDCIIGFGCVFSDLNTMNFDLNFDKSKFIDINLNYTIINNKKYDNVLINDVIKSLNKKIRFKYNKLLVRNFRYNQFKVTQKKQLTCEYIYSKLEKFLKEGDIFINEVGLSSFGVLPMTLPKDISVQNQILWGSIGWATPCTLGCAIAKKDKRVIMITGEGAHQMTAQEISTIMRHKLKPIIFIINNSGYTVERILCSNTDAEYNNIASWNYSLLPKIFKGNCFVKQIKTNIEFDKVLKKIKTINKDKMCYIELFTEYLDTPALSKAISKYHV